MNLYFLRHAPALDRAEWKKPDAERPLTDKGRKKMKAIAAGIRALGVEADWILTSPYRRAYDTAVLLAKALDASKRVRVSRSLAPDGDPKALVRRLALDFRSWETVVLVGHEPYLSTLATVLIGAAESSLALKKGGLLHLSAASLTFGPCAALEALYPPKTLRKIR